MKYAKTKHHSHLRSQILPNLGGIVCRALDGGPLERVFNKQKVQIDASGLRFCIFGIFQVLTFLIYLFFYCQAQFKLAVQCKFNRELRLVL